MVLKDVSEMVGSGSFFLCRGVAISDINVYVDKVDNLRTGKEQNAIVVD